MRPSTLVLLGLSSLATAIPIRRSVNNNVVDEFKNIDGFPNPSKQQVLKIYEQAHGTLSNSTPPSTVDPDTILSLQVIVAEEEFEAAFYQQLLTNVTMEVPGFHIENLEAREVVVKALTAIVAVCGIQSHSQHIRPLIGQLLTRNK